MFNFIKKLFGPGVDFKALAAAGALIIDVRTPEEFKQGHLKGSVNIPLQIIAGKIPEIQKKNKVVIAICRTGSRSSMATGMMKRAGIEAYNGGSWNGLAHKINA
ncbi:MAG: rhodanese-like domain-containing protein [Lewinellaceae bacterium]|nr:rhodanese-like domain-containing protein [Lewinellaceae bacterium]